MRLEHHLVGGYVRYISPYIIIIPRTTDIAQINCNKYIYIYIYIYIFYIKNRNLLKSTEKRSIYTAA